MDSTVFVVLGNALIFAAMFWGGYRFFLMAKMHGTYTYEKPSEKVKLANTLAGIAFIVGLFITITAKGAQPQSILLLHIAYVFVRIVVGIIVFALSSKFVHASRVAREESFFMICLWGAISGLISHTSLSVPVSMANAVFGFSLGLYVYLVFARALGKLNELKPIHEKQPKKER